MALSPLNKRKAHKAAPG